MLQTSEGLLADIERLAPSIAQRRAEIESLGCIPADLVETLRSIGIFRMLVPHDYGGLELEFPAALAIISALGKIDGSVGWTAMIGASSTMFASTLSKASYDNVYRHGPDIVFAGSGLSSGTAEPVEGGWRVTGRWTFASGCLHADWMLVHCVMQADGVPLPGPVDGTPLVRGFVLPAREFRIEDSWHVMGLKGTGSHNIALDDVFVPAVDFFEQGGPPCLPGPLYRAVLPLIPLMHAANSLGMAEGALRDLARFAMTGHRQLRAATTLRDSELFQAGLGRVEAELRAAGAFLRDQAASHWRHALAGTLNVKEFLPQSTQAATWITKTCVSAVDTCFELGGIGTIFETSPLQRRMRDLHAAAQHVAVQPRNYIAAGATLLSRMNP